VVVYDRPIKRTKRSEKSGTQTVKKDTETSKNVGEASDPDLVGTSKGRVFVPCTPQGHSLPLDTFSTSLSVDGTEDNVHLLQTAPLGLWNDQGEGAHHTNINGGIHDEDFPPEVGDPHGGVVTNDEIYKAHVRITVIDGKMVNSTHSITTGTRMRQQDRNVLS